MTKPFILLTNDDGIHAPGLRHLWQALKEHADIAIVAPAVEQSCVSLSVTLRHPLRIQEVLWPEKTAAWSVNGTPADCIRLALGAILTRRPHFVISGINRGSNVGRTVLYSGTVAGIMEAAIQNLPGLAFSHSDYFEPDYIAIEKYISLIFNDLQKHPLPLGTLLNVNFPSKDWGPIKGIKMARQGRGYWGENLDQRQHPSEGDTYYWMGAQFKAFEEDLESDVHLLHQGYITAVPIHVAELTDHRHLGQHKAPFEERLNTIFMN